MSEPEALRLADALDAYWYGRAVLNDRHMAESAAELRRLHAENEALRADLTTYMQIANEQAQADDTALLRQALEALNRRHSEQFYPAPDYLRDAIAALRKRLGEKK